MRINKYCYILLYLYAIKTDIKGLSDGMEKYLANANQFITDKIVHVRVTTVWENTAVVASNTGDTPVPYGGTGVFLESPKIGTA